MKKIFTWILSKLWLPKFDPIRDWNPNLYEETFDGTNHWVNLGPEGECGTAKPKKYRDAIHRVSVEGI